MFTTVEVRWISNGVIPPAVLDWFSRLHRAGEPAQRRTDHYFAGDAVMGIKVRESRIEIKFRIGELGGIRLSDHVEGRLEHWCKWSFELSGSDSAVPPASGAESLWVAVEKERHTAKYQVSPDRAVHLVQPDAQPENGCDFEVTGITIEGTKWWSVGFEAYGKTVAAMRETLSLVASRVLETGVPFELREKDSRSYPELLAGLR